MNEYYNNQTSRIPYMGGSPVRCPRCSNVVNNRYCNFCGLDLSTVYFKTQEQAQQPQQQTYDHPFQQHIQQPQIPLGQPYQQPYGQYPYNNMYNYTPKQRKNKGWIIGVVAVATVLCLYLLVRLLAYNLGFWSAVNNKQQNKEDSFLPPQAQEELHFPGGVSSEEFKKLKNGMSYAQISSIIGGDGEIVNSGEDLKKETYYTYGWVGEDNPNAIVYITITTDKVSDITLEGNL